jgi:hypothetical protein
VGVGRTACCGLFRRLTVWSFGASHKDASCVIYVWMNEEEKTGEYDFQLLFQSMRV